MSIQLDEIYPLIFQESVFVRIFNFSIFCHSDSQEILGCHSIYCFPLRNSCALNDFSVHREHRCIDSIRRQHPCGREHSAEIIYRINQQDEACDSSCLSFVVSGHDCCNISHLCHVQCSHFDSVFVRIFSARHNNALSDLFHHTDWLIFSSSLHDTVLQPVCQCLIEHLTHVCIQPCRS